MAGGFAIALPAFAQTDALDTVGTASGLGQEDLRLVVARIIRTFLTVLGVIAVIIVIYGGFTWMTAGGEAEKVEKAKKILLNGGIGLAIILLSWAITSFIISALLGATGTGGSGTSSGSGGAGSGLGGGSVTSFAVSGIRPEGEVSIRNVQVSVTFSRTLDSTTVDGNLVVTNTSTGEVITGTTTASGSRATFTPDAACPSPNEDRFCFDENTEFTVTLDGDILSSAGLALDCDAGCTSSFTTGELIDTEDPSASIEAPDAGDRISIDSSEGVQVEATDDSEVATGDFAVDSVNFDSVSASGDDLSDVLLETTWYTDGLTEGTRYELQVTVTDIAGNTDEDTLSIRATASSCYDEEQNGDETAVDCGGSCGACEGEGCSESSECASDLDCVDGTCTSTPEITEVSPPSGAPGTYVTITGTGFGSGTGTVTFVDSTGASTVEAEIPSCAEGWSDTEIIVEVPATAGDGEITVTTAQDLVDATDDDNGSLIDDFDVNEIERPNLCRLSPSTGYASSAVGLTGTNFGEAQDDSIIYFGTTEAGSYTSWSSTSARVTAPTVAAGDYEVNITVDAVTSNSVSYTVIDNEEETPTINYVSPDEGGIGQYVTIVGSNFGNSTGSVYFDNQSSGYRALGSDDFPEQCSDNFWGDEEITIIVPDSYTNDLDLDATTHDVMVVTRAGDESNTVEFTVSTAEPSPGICAIDPENGLPGDTVTIYGEKLGSTSGSAAFYNEASATVASGGWSDSAIVTTVPESAETGPVSITSSSLEESNTINFEISSDSSDTTTAQGAGYAWQFSTGQIPETPELYVECSDDRVSGVPNNQFTSGGVCTNAMVFGAFNMLMQEASFVDGDSVLIEECADSTCATTTTVSGTITVSDSTDATSVKWRPLSTYNAGEFKTSTTYQVTFTTDVTSADLQTLADDVTWKFSTSAVSEPCEVEEVRVEPIEATIVADDETSEFLALPLTGCVVLDSASYSWTWDADDSVAAITEGDCEDSSGDDCAVASPNAQGETSITATEDDSDVSGDGTLIVDYTDPYVLNYWPNCNTACVDAEVGLSFNIPMDSSTVQATGAALLYECINELCLSLTQLANQAYCLDPADCDEIYFDYGPLAVDTYYRVVISGDVTSTSAVPLTRTNYGTDYSWIFSTKDDATQCSVSRVEISPEDVVLEVIGQTQSYQGTAYGEPDDCSESGQRLSSYGYNWEWENPIIEDTGVAYWYTTSSTLLDVNTDDIAAGCTASCLPAGSSEYYAVCGDLAVGTGEDCDDGDAESNDGCSATCQAEGTDVCAQVCSSTGNSCDADSDCQETCDTATSLCTVSGDSCTTDADCTYYASTCDFTGTDCCGNGSAEYSSDGAGEECDDGNADDGDGCSSSCTNEGASAVGATCGNGSIGQSEDLGGEDCDDGNKANGDGCSSVCLNEGSTGETDVEASCGDGIVDAPYETCDDSDNDNGDGCSASCLREGASADYSLFGSTGRCGDGTTNQNSTTSAGEDCDSATDEGCSDECLWLGSSTEYSEPSVCGDGVTGTGEIAACEASAGDGDIDPIQVAVIDSDAGDYVDLETHLATATIRTEIDGVGAQTSLSLSCVAETDDDCPDGYGVADNSCCMARPEATLYPNGSNTCRNAALYGIFTTEMAVESFTSRACSTTTTQACSVDSDCPTSETCELSSNVYIELDPATTDSGSCPSGYNTVAMIGDGVPNNFLARIWYRIVNFFVGSADARVSGCFVPLTSVSQTAVSDGTYKVSFNYSVALESSATYTIHVDGDTVGDAVFEGVTSADGVEMDGDVEQEFSTGTEVCTLDQIDVEDTDSDSPNVFSLQDEEHDFTATTYSFSTGSRQEITSLSGVYAWTWLDWQEDSSDTIVTVDSSTDDEATISAVGVNGKASVVASATVTDFPEGALHCEVTTSTSCDSSSDCPSGEACVGDTVIGDQAVTAFICENPWPNPDTESFPFVDDSTSTITGVAEGAGWMNFSTYFCRDAGEDGTTDDLQGVSVVASTPASSSILKEYFLIYGDSSGDAIGVRIAKNENYLNPSAWYAAQGFAGSPSIEEHDGFEALRDGRTVYVMAPNLSSTTLYPNMYVISYNEGASESVINIFNQIVANLGLATNAADINLCYNGVSYSSEVCTSDADCDSGETCGSVKDKIARDSQRMTDIQEIATDLTAYGQDNGLCSETSANTCTTDSDCPSGESCESSVPTLPSGSYVPALSTSAWPSWSGALTDALGEELPTDPLNFYQGCGASPYASYDATTCVNQVAGEYLCPADSYVYHYRSVGPFSYELAAELEYQSADWAYDIDSDLTDDYEIMIGGNSTASPDGFIGGPAYCDASVYGASTTCGDGTVGGSEVCEIGDTSTAACDTSDASADLDGSIRTTCASDCLSYTTSTTDTCAAADCGDGVTAGTEDCDDGSLNGTYGYCGTGCTWTTAYYCGDGNIAGSEVCDCGSSTVSGRAYGGAACTVLNGVWDESEYNTCASDCTGAGPYCGNGDVESGETCDGNTQEYDGKLCAGGLNVGEECDSSSDCPNLSVYPAPTTYSSCGSPGTGYEWADECSISSVCLEGDTDLIGTVCDADADCDTDSTSADGVCSDAVYQTTRVMTCADDGAGGEDCTWNDDNWQTIACSAEANCGNGSVEGTEECDDGNTDSTDECTNACTIAYCGDGYVESGSESCDEGSENGTVCSSAYESTCTYCTNDCQYATTSGTFCGDGEINGDEFCDAGDVPAYYFNSTYSDIGDTCTGSGSTSIADSADLDGDGNVTETFSYTCTAAIGICNGGTSTGEYCDSSTDCGTGYECVFAECAASCANTCPTTFEDTTLLLRTNELGASRSSSIDLYSNTGTVTSGNAATVYIPACDAIDTLVVDIDDSNRVYPDVEIMFVLDKSRSMATSLTGTDGSTSTRLEILQDAVSEASSELFDAYDGLSATMKIGYAYIGNTHGTESSTDDNTTYDDLNSEGTDEWRDFAIMSPTDDEDSLLSSMSTNLASVDSVTGTPIYKSIYDAKAAFSGTADVEYLIIFTDGDIYNPDLSKLAYGSTLMFNDSDGSGAIGSSEYVAAVTSMAQTAKNQDVKIFTAAFTDDSCDITQMARWSSMDCTEDTSISCSDWEDQGSVSCEVPSEGVTYAYSATTATELYEMYDAIVAAILNINVTLGIGDYATYTSAPSGNNVELEIPTDFVCDGTDEQSVYLKANWYGGGTIGFEDMSINACMP